MVRKSVWTYPLYPFSFASIALMPILIATLAPAATLSVSAGSLPPAHSPLELPPLPSFSAYQPIASPQPASLPETATIRLVLRLQARQLYVYQGENAIATYPVAIGRPSTPTPTGEFKVFEMLENPAWQNPRTGEVEAPGADGSLGTRWMAFANMPNGVIGFHGTPNRASIGSAASHGCVRMRNEDAEALFQQIGIGTVVKVES